MSSFMFPEVILAEKLQKPNLKKPHLYFERSRSVEASALGIRVSHNLSDFKGHLLYFHTLWKANTYICLHTIHPLYIYSGNMLDFTSQCTVVILTTTKSSLVWTTSNFLHFTFNQITETLTHLSVNLNLKIPSNSG